MRKALIPLTLIVLGLGACSKPASEPQDQAAAQAPTPVDPQEKIAAAKADAAQIRADVAQRDALAAKLSAEAARKKEGQ